MKKVLLALVLAGCPDSATVITRNQYPGLQCFGSKDDFSLCINSHSERFVCFASQEAKTSLCLAAVNPIPR